MLKYKERLLTVYRNFNMRLAVSLCIREGISMEAYELDKEKVVDWAINYASYDELESAAKAVYAVFGERRKKRASRTTPPSKRIQKEKVG